MVENLEGASYPMICWAAANKLLMTLFIRLYVEEVLRKGCFPLKV